MTAPNKKALMSILIIIPLTILIQFLISICFNRSLKVWICSGVGLSASPA